MPRGNPVLVQQMRAIKAPVFSILLTGDSNRGDTVMIVLCF